MTGRKESEEWNIGEMLWRVGERDGMGMEVLRDLGMQYRSNGDL